MSHLHCDSLCFCLPEKPNGPLNTIYIGLTIRVVFSKGALGSYDSMWFSGVDNQVFPVIHLREVPSARVDIDLLMGGVEVSSIELYVGSYYRGLLSGDGDSSSYSFTYEVGEILWYICKSLSEISLAIKLKK